MTTISGRSNDQEFTGDLTRVAPTHWNPEWRQIPVTRRTPDRPRSPLSRLENRAYWEGYRLGWEGWLDIVGRRGYDAALLVRPSGLAVLDCDVKSYAGELVCHSDNPNLVTLEGATVKHGIDDLVRLARELGRDPAELATYTVRTRSGGFHLYYDVGERLARGQVLRTRHHRDEWRIDVIASENSWVAAPPTPGYEVVRDRSVAVMPDWLWEAVAGINRLRGPLGGSRRRELDRRARGLRSRVEPVECDGDVFKTYLRTQCELVRLANRLGGWNSTIFEVACDLFTLGLRPVIVENLLLEAAEPWDDRQRGSVLATVRSAREYKLESLTRGARR